MTQRSIDPHHPTRQTVAAVKRTNDEQRMPEVENEAMRQRSQEHTERTTNPPTPIR